MKNRKRQLITGLLYVSLVFIGPFTLLLLPEMFREQENLLNYINENKSYIWAWIIGDTLIIGIEILLSTFLYFIFRQVNKRYSIIMYIARLSMVLIMLINLILLVRLLFTGSLTNDSANNILSLHHSMIYVWEAFFFVHLLLLGLVLIKYNSIVKYIGYGVLIGSFGYLFDTIIYFGNITNSFIISVGMLLLGIVALSETIFGIYLIITKKNLSE